MRRILILLATLLPLLASAQGLNPSDYISPIRDVAGLYAANFGEMRPGHFHAGVALQTDGVEGKVLVAVADGYISRVVITAGGYGRAVYLTLHNGKCAVYGHLQRFPAAIEAYVQQERRRRATNEISLYFPPTRWPVRQGEVVGYSGNSGSSSGPHLHFELRDTATQLRHNLVKEGVLRPKDTLPPRILRLHYVEVDTLQGVPVRTPLMSYGVVRKSEGVYQLTRQDLLPVGPCGYFIAEVSDRRNDVYNRFGIWRLTAKIDGEPYFEYRMDGFTYEQARTCDAVSCYALQLDAKNEVLRLAQLGSVPTCFYPVMVERGVIRTEEGQQRQVTIEVEDDSGNISRLCFAVQGEPSSFHPQVDSTFVALSPKQTEHLHLGRECFAKIPAGALYEPSFARIERLAAPRLDTGVVVLSPSYRLLERRPLYRPMHLRLCGDIPSSLHLRATLAHRSANGKWGYGGGTYRNGGVEHTTRSTGEFAIVADTLPPTITPLFEPQTLSESATSLCFSVKDNFSGIASYQLSIDGVALPCDRYPSRSLIVYNLPKQGTPSPHRVVLVVRDGCGNSTRWEENLLIF